jgi:hypothetical protein
VPPFFFFTILVKSSRTILNKSGNGGQPCLIPDFRGKAIGLRGMLAGATFLGGSY